MKGVNKYIIVLSFKRQVCFCDDFKAGNDQRQVAELHGGNQIQLNMPNHSSQLKKAIGHFFFQRGAWIQISKLERVSFAAKHCYTPKHTIACDSYLQVM